MHVAELIAFLVVIQSLLQFVHASESYANGDQCCSDVRCLNVSEYFRQNVVPPTDISNINQPNLASFCLFTTENPSECEPLVFRRYRLPSAVRHFNNSHPTVVIIHGIFEHHFILEPTWIMDMKNQFLIKTGYNIIIMDWSKVNTVHALSNAQIVAFELSHLICSLMFRHKVSAKSIHLIGHGIGAHLAGMVGSRVKTIGRITGLDPFKLLEKNPEKRLDKSDAAFVDVIHSSINGLGEAHPSGHIDFYPNGGLSNPECENVFGSLSGEGIKEGLRRYGFCNHMQAFDFFTSSINMKKCQLVAYPCPGWKQFQSGWCHACSAFNGTCPLMGLQSISSQSHLKGSESLVLYLNTGTRKKYCSPYYWVNLELAPDNKVDSYHGQWELVVGDEFNRYTVQIPYKLFYSGSSYKFLITLPEQINSVQIIGLKWIRNYKLTDWWKNGFRNKIVGIRRVQLKPLFLTDAKISTFCATDGRPMPMEPNVPVFLTRRLC